MNVLWLPWNLVYLTLYEARAQNSQLGAASRPVRLAQKLCPAWSSRPSAESTQQCTPGLRVP